MTAPCFRDDLLIELACVVRAQQPPGLAVTERHVQQRLVTLSRAQLVARASVPDWLTDAADPLALGAMLLHEVAPRRDDARGVGPYLGHVGKQDTVRVIVQRRAQELDLVWRLHHEHGLTGREPVADEGHCPGDEFRPVAVEESLVPEAVGRPR